MSAIGMPGPQRPFVISATGYDHSQLFFERQQSISLQSMTWEGRIRPLTPWSTLIARGAGTVVLLSAMIALLH